MAPDRISILTVSPFDEDHRVIEAILRRSNWAHHTARTIAEALRLMRSADVSVILCERDLPAGNWKDLLAAVVASELAPRLILMSAVADERLWVEALNLGAFDVLLKPLEPCELFRVASLAHRSWRGRAPLASSASLVAGAARSLGTV